MKEQLQEELKNPNRPNAEEMKQQKRAASQEMPSTELTRKKAITLLGAANGKIGELVKKMDKQYELTLPYEVANEQKSPKEGDDQEAAVLEQTRDLWKNKSYLMKRYSDLVHLNKYVGYRSKKVKVSQLINHYCLDISFSNLYWIIFRYRLTLQEHDYCF